ncbi:hypothetical protein [Paenarthrobacter ilicis]|uniref:Uncharacterized protein n=1 Tax=Paenarthrobacter ilicis TaxID=43665 RepID=A0ABX0TJG2_9MICC|nr:hypothetical protein [Paenarthrobacter ilicis]MBM7794450.1 hypothetical protein [Paenarthrobacter ilicis]NIJ02274.1 hypothetical protein [Paenarthrobacter ilicis]
MTRTAFQRVSLIPEAEAACINTEVIQMRAELETVDNNGQDNGRANASIIKRLEKAVLAQEKTLKAKLDTPADPASASRKPALSTSLWTSCTTTRTWKHRRTSPAPRSQAQPAHPIFT